MIGYGIWDQTAGITNRYLRQYLRDLFCEVQMDFPGVRISHDLEQLIDTYNTNHLVIFGSGHTTRHTVQLRSAIESFCAENEFIIAGHIINQFDSIFYPWLHPQMFILDLERYRAIGSPPLGYFEQPVGSGSLELHRPHASPDNVHDNYTPLWLKPTGQKVDGHHRNFGWNIISKSLDAGVPVLNLPSTIRAAKRYLYPIHQPHLFADSLEQLANDQLVNIPEWLDPQQKEYLRELMLPGVNCRTFLFNTEPLVGPWMSGIKRIFGVAAGFKLFVLWNQMGGTAEPVYYDHNAVALQTWRHIVMNWSGRNFAEFCQRHHYGDDQHLMQRVIDAVGAEDALEIAWRRFQATQPKFILCDILTRPEVLVAEMADSGNYVWYSNCFRFFEGIRRFGMAGCERRQERFLELLKTRAPDTLAVGSGVTLI